MPKKTKEEEKEKLTSMISKTTVMPWIDNKKSSIVYSSIELPMKKSQYFCNRIILPSGLDYYNVTAALSKLLYIIATYHKACGYFYYNTKAFLNTKSTTKHAYLITLKPHLVT